VKNQRLLPGFLLVVLLCAACSTTQSSITEAYMLRSDATDTPTIDPLVLSMATRKAEATIRALTPSPSPTLTPYLSTTPTSLTSSTRTQTQTITPSQTKTPSSTPIANCKDPATSLLDYDEMRYINYWFNFRDAVQKDEELDAQFCPVSCAKRVWLGAHESLTLLLIQNKNSAAAVKSVESTWRAYEDTNPSETSPYDPYDGTDDGRFIVQFEYIDTEEDTLRIDTVLARAVDDIFLMIVQTDEFQYSETFGYSLHRNDILLSLHAIECVQLEKMCGITNCKVYY
jgi:hypothetical protein